MQPTARVAAWATWAGWASGAEDGRWATAPRGRMQRRRLRVALHQLQPPLYTPDQLRHLIRLETALGRWPPTAPPPLWRPDARPYDLDSHWRLPDVLPNIRMERGGAAGGVSTGAGEGALGSSGGTGVPRGWEGAARGWAAGAVLLAVLLLLVRALERCLHKRLFKGRRRPSEEWPRPNVMATSCQYGGAGLPRLDDSDSSDNRDTSSTDLPPPYSECANSEEVSSSDVNKPVGMEEPPPPYSACYFSNPKDGIPTVHFYSRRNNLNNFDVGQSSADSETAPSLSIIRSQEADKISNCDVICEGNKDLGNTNQRSEVRSDNRTINTDVIEIVGDSVEEGDRHRSFDRTVDIEEPDSQEIVVRV